MTENENCGIVSLMISSPVNKFQTKLPRLVFMIKFSTWKQKKAVKNAIGLFCYLNFIWIHSKYIYSMHWFHLVSVCVCVRNIGFMF